MKRPTHTALIVIILLVFAISGCRTGEREEITLTINYPSQQQFLEDYGYAFEHKNPHISIRVIQDPSDNSTRAPDTDVIFMNSVPLYQDYIEQGLLVDIKTLEHGTDKHLKSYTPIVLALLRSAADNGELYGLSPFFQSKALYYNKALFNKYGIPYPKDGMSWKEVFELAMRFPRNSDSGEQLYGLELSYYRDVYLNTLLETGQTRGLSYLNPHSLQVTINSDTWKSVWEEAVPVFRSGAVYGDNMDQEAMTSPQFLLGNSAMMIASNSLAYNFKPFSEFKSGRSIDWGIVTVPIDVANPTVSRSYNIYSVYGVSRSSIHPEDAWKLVKFIAGDPDNSRYLAKIRHGSLPSVIEAVAPIDGRDLSPLYSLKAVNDVQDPYLFIDATIPDAFRAAVQPILEEAINGTLSIDDAFVLAQEKGQQAVDSAAVSSKGSN